MHLPARTNSGSSPRMRGALFHTYVWMTRIRIIPAYAGSTPYTTTAQSPRKDHPRACGEHSV